VQFHKTTVYILDGFTVHFKDDIKMLDSWRPVSDYDRTRDRTAKLGTSQAGSLATLMSTYAIIPTRKCCSGASNLDLHYADY